MIEGRSLFDFRRAISPILCPVAGSWFSEGVLDPILTYFERKPRLYFTGCRSSEECANGVATPSDLNDYQKSWVPLHGSPILSGAGGDSWESKRVTYPQVIIWNETYYMSYDARVEWGHSRKGLACASDPESRQWTKHSNNPYVEIQGWEKQVAWGDHGFCPDDNRWHIFYSDGHNIGYATSSDVTSWQKCSGNPIITPEKIGLSSQNGDMVLAPCVLKKGESGELVQVANNYWMILTGRKKLDDGSYWSRMNLAESKDLNHWQAKPIVVEPGAGCFDSEDLIAQSFVEIDGSIYVAYQGKGKLRHDERSLWRIGLLKSI